jgi:hypothetical protein
MPASQISEKLKRLQYMRAKMDFVKYCNSADEQLKIWITRRNVKIKRTSVP